MSAPLHIPTLTELFVAQRRISDTVLRTPLLRLDTIGLARTPDCEIWLKCENLQPVGSFKIRPGLNAVRALDTAALDHGVYTASSGNMAQGVAFACYKAGIPCRVSVVKGQPAQSKLDALSHLNAEVIELEFDDFWQLVVAHHHPDEQDSGKEGVFIHPVSNQHVIAGDGTVGMEILEDMPDVDTIVVPHGGGGLVCGIASAVRAMDSGARVLSAECSESTPVKDALAAGKPVDVEPLQSFITGVGVGPVLDDMWPLIRELVDGTVSAPIGDICEAIRILFQRAHLVAEGAGAVATAAVVNGQAGSGKIVCIVSGGNIDADIMSQILRGNTPHRAAD